MKKFINWCKSSSSDFALFLVLLILANVAGYKAFKRFDLTQPKSYSLSKASQSIVKNLEEPLAIRVFFDKNLPAPYNSVAQYVEDFLDEYKAAANKKLTVSYMDMSKEENQDIASDFNLKQIQIQEYKNNEVGFKQVYMGLVVSYGDSIEVIDPVTTSDGFEYTLTSTVSKMINTAAALEGIKGDEKIQVSVYISEPLKRIGVNGCDQLEFVANAAFNEVNQQKQNRLQFNTYHPVGEEAREVIEKYGLQGISFVNENDQRDVGVFGVVVEYGDNFKVLPVMIEQSYFGYMVSGYDDMPATMNAGVQSLLAKTTSIGYIEGNAELNLDDEKAGKTFADMLSSMYEIQRLDLVTQDIPMGMSSIIINGPQSEISEYELYKIDQFIMRGGNVIFFMDALLPNPDGKSDIASIRNESGIDTLLNAYGIKRNFDVVLSKQCFQSSSSQYGKLDMYWAPVLQKKQMNQKHPITSNLGYVLFVNSGSLDVTAANENPNTKVTVLAKSADKSWTGDENTICHPLTMSAPSDESGMKSETLAVLVEGKFKSAFEKAPEFLPEDMKINLGFDADNHISESRLPGKIFVCGTSQITTYNVLGSNPNPIGNPIQIFEANLVDYMNGNEELCKMRSKGLSLNVLTIKNGALAKLLQFFNEFGIAVLVAVAGLIIWRMRSKRKQKINAQYNPNDTRTIVTEKKTKKASKEEKKEE